MWIEFDKDFAWLAMLPTDYFHPWSAPVVISTIQSLDDETVRAMLLLAAAGAAWEVDHNLN